MFKSILMTFEEITWKVLMGLELFLCVYLEYWNMVPVNWISNIFWEAYYIQLMKIRRDSCSIFDFCTGIKCPWNVSSVFSVILWVYVLLYYISMFSEFCKNKVLPWSFSSKAKEGRVIKEALRTLLLWLQWGGKELKHIYIRDVGRMCFCINLSWLKS